MLLHEFGLSLSVSRGAPHSPACKKTVLTTERAAVVLAKIQGIMGERTWAHGEKRGAQRASATDWRGDHALEAEVYQAAESMLNDTLVVYIGSYGKPVGVLRERLTTRSEKAECTLHWC